MTAEHLTAERFTGPCTFHGEGPFWDDVDGRLLVVDMLDGAVVAVDDAGAAARHDVGTIAAVIRQRAAGGFVVAVEHAFLLLDRDFQPVEAPVPVLDDPGIRLNEGGCDPQGRFYCGTMAYDVTPGAGTLYRLDADRGVHEVLTGVTISNGLQWSADGATAYYDDTPTQRVQAFDFDAAAGLLVRPRTFVTIAPDDGAPDGMAIDTDGGIWVALWGGHGVRRYDASGALTTIVDVPIRQVSACAFGGPDRSTLYVTTSRQGPDAVEDDAGSIYAVETGFTGAVPHAYAG